ncbi:MAG: hypothetical protein WBE87_13555 [Candidatus Acidiferrales bacterium]
MKFPIRKALVYAASLAVLSAIFPAINLAQTATPPAQKQVIQVSPGYLESMGAQMKFGRANKMPANLAMTDPRIVSVRHFTGAFNFQGQTYPYMMVGQRPAPGNSSRIPNQVRSIIAVFPDFVDQNGNPIVLDATQVQPQTLGSPIWQPSPFTSGLTQWGDAIQRASLFQFLKDPDHDGDVDTDWHTLLQQPSIQQPLVIEVPASDVNLFEVPNGTIFAVVNEEFWLSQLDTIFQLQNIDTSQLSVVLSRNVFLAPNADITQCCILGFHTVFELNSNNPNVIPLETLINATWVDPGIFLSPNVADIHPLSHEVAEWYADPFVNNVVPPWLNPEDGGCSNILEVGDMLLGDTSPISWNGFLYHPQSVALLPWFSRQQPSLALGGAYSYPDTSALTSPAPVCTATPASSSSSSLLLNWKP